MQFWKRIPAVAAMLVIAVGASFATFDHADARRGGSFGSRGVRTFQAPAVTPTAPRAATPVQRSMTPQQPSAATAAAPGVNAARPGFFGGFGGSMLRGLAIGGLFGLLLGHGFGGLAGGFGFIVQIALLALGAWFLMRFLANRRQQQPAGAGMAGGPSFRDMMGGGGAAASSYGGATGAAAPGASMSPRSASDEIGLGEADFNAFERLLGEIQGAFGREDYAALRERTTPEVMSYLSEELSQNATTGLRNEVTDVKLLQGDLSEGWREGDTDYATVAMRYESRDVMKERDSGRIVTGDSEKPTETTEIWTFARRLGAEWKLSAIQEI
jgi:predicted lipid-binding transport protein (Tim44 family)